MFASLNLKLIGLIANAAIIIGLVFALLITRSTLSEVKHERDMAEAKLLVSNGSIDTLEGEIKRMREEAENLATNDAARIAESRQAIKMAEAVAKVRRAAIQRLEQSAADMMAKPIDAATGGACEASPALLQEWR